MRIRWPILFQLLVLATLMIGGLAASVLLIRSQDVRQQASTGFDHGAGVPTCTTSSQCIGPNQKLWCPAPGVIAQEVEGKCGVPAKIVMASTSATPASSSAGLQQGSRCDDRLGECIGGKVCLPGSRSFSAGPTVSAFACNATLAGRYCDFDAECQSGKCSVNGVSGGGTCLSQGTTPSPTPAIGPEESACAAIRSNYDCEEDRRCVWQQNRCLSGDRCRTDAPIFPSPIINSIRCYDPGYSQVMSQCSPGYRPSLDGRRCEYELSASSQCQNRGLFYEQGRRICDPDRADRSLICESGTFREVLCTGGNVCVDGACVTPTERCNAETLGQCIGGKVCSRNPITQSYQLAGLGCFLSQEGSTCQYDADCQSRTCENTGGRRVCGAGRAAAESQLAFCSQPAYRCQNAFLPGAELCRDSFSNQKFCCPSGTEKIESGCVLPANVPRAPSRPIGEQVGESVIGAVENVGTAVVDDIEFRGQAIHGLLTLPTFEERVAAGALALMPGLGTTQQACQGGLTLDCATSIGVTSVVGAAELTGAASVLQVPGYSQLRGSVVETFSTTAGREGVVARVVGAAEGYTTAFTAVSLGMTPADVFLARQVINNNVRIAVNAVESVSITTVSVVAGTGTGLAVVERTSQVLTGASRVVNQFDEIAQLVAPVPPAYDFGKDVIGVEYIPIADQVVGCIDSVTKDAAELLLGTVATGEINTCTLQ